MKKTLFIAGMAAAILMSTSVTYAATTNAAARAADSTESIRAAVSGL